MILIALGSNMPGPWGSSRQTVERAVTELNQFPLRCLKVSRLMITKAYGVENQADFVNAVVEIETALSPESLLRKLHQIERAAGRKRGRRWGPRMLDLDLLAYHNVKRSQRGPLQKPLVLPHPGINQRSFVLEPLREIAQRWRHPASHQTPMQMLRSLRY
jgi:2-amino-4-hydroxy-6-hydroxymethyldihydropteridine diphosphokinase